ncbi:MAG: U32 family peptidase [Bacteroidaceae bacterium]|nr:U32 family peptidase [Bacteroidaceae bacterium]
MNVLRPIELLSPAKDADCGIEAVKHGADAVYIGASAYGARAAACNSVSQIARLVQFAHAYRAKVYVTVNTILRQEELPGVQSLVWDLYYAGVDAILVQDMALFALPLPPIDIHASTQMDVRTPEKVRFLASCGVKRVVLARELSLKEIREIHAACPDVELEAFVHGALCVSYSGQCYASECCFGRSANRGECAQFCRLKFDLLDADRKLIATKHYLSLKDMNRSESLEEMIDAGVSSFKIEGRLKDVTYVKNITAYYSRNLNRIIQNRKDLLRASDGESTVDFTPDPVKSFNRGFTDYYLHGIDSSDITSFDSPKSKGEYMGVVSRSAQGVISVNYADKEHTGLFNNGDGICFAGQDGTLEGARVNRVDRDMLYLYDRHLRIPHGARIYRNFDQNFTLLLQRNNTAERRICVDMVVSQTDSGFALSVTDAAGFSAVYAIEQPKEPARTEQTTNIKLQLSKLGETVFCARNIEIDMSGQWFIPSSRLAELKRGAIAALIKERNSIYEREVGTPARMLCENPTVCFNGAELDYRCNVLNDVARDFYLKAGAERVMPAYESCQPSDAVIMSCRHCIRRAEGMCLKNKSVETSAFQPKYLRMGDGRVFQLEFDCKNCQMNVLDTARAQR